MSAALIARKEATEPDHATSLSSVVKHCRTHCPLPATLYLYPPIKELHLSMEQYFNAQQVPFDTPYQGMFAIRFSEGELRQHCREYFGGLEQADAGRHQKPDSAGRQR